VTILSMLKCQVAFNNVFNTTKKIIHILACPISDFCALKNVCAETPRNSATETTMFSF